MHKRTICALIDCCHRITPNALPAVDWPHHQRAGLPLPQSHHYLLTYSHCRFIIRIVHKLFPNCGPSPCQLSRRSRALHKRIITVKCLPSIRIAQTNDTLRFAAALLAFH